MPAIGATPRTEQSDYDNGYDDGYDQGHNDGYYTGYALGFDEGYAKAESEFTSLAQRKGKPSKDE